MNIYYVYAYLRASDNTPYYIGKGKLNRAYDKRHSVKVPKNKNKIIFLETNLSEIEAFEIECKMILLYGRKDLGTGILRNQTNGGEGASGKIVSEQQKEKMRERISGEKNPMFGEDPWNKGLTKETSEVLSSVGQKIKKSFDFRNVSGENNHFFGKKHSEGSLIKMRKPRKNVENLGKHKRSESQKDFNRNQMLELHKRKKTCEVCKRTFDPGNYTKHKKKCF
jgi:hypothetical protein